jgi:hypothetical protein
MDNKTWRDELDERELKEVELALLYAKEFHHGTAGHNRLMLIAKLAAMLDEVQETYQEDE